jgi:hypothetical protein
MSRRCQQRSSALARSTTLVGSAERARFRATNFMEWRQWIALLRLEAGELDHLSPLLGFLCDELGSSTIRDPNATIDLDTPQADPGGRVTPRF